MKTLFLTLCAFATLSCSAFAGGYTLEDFNRDQDHRALQAQFDAEDIAAAADQRAQELQDKLDEIEAQLEEQQSQQEPEPQPRPLTRREAGFVSFGDYANAGKAPRAQLVKLPVKPLARREQVNVCTP